MDFGKSNCDCNEENQFRLIVLSVLDISEIGIYEFWNDYIKEKCDRAQICYNDPDSFLFHIKMEDIYEYIKDGAEQDLIHLTVKLRPLLLKKNKKAIGIIKNELDG